MSSKKVSKQETQKSSQGPKSSSSEQGSRRDFIKTSSLLVAGSTVGSTLSMARSAHASGSDVIKIGLVGCGGRGTGAAVQAMNTEGEVRLIAMADAFEDRVEGAYKRILGEHPNKVDVPAERRFHGFDSFKNVLDSDIDLVILATPPGFRPLHFESAVNAGKHVFMEKPVATDAPGVRRVLEANEVARSKGLAVAVGLQRHHEVAYQEMMDQLKNGIIGDINLIRVYWNGAGVWTRPREPQQTELEYQMRNWYYFNWLCGDHIVEQHIHNLDVGNWLMDAYPVTANGMGGREVRVGPDTGEIFDHHFLEFTYANGTKMFSQCRHIPNCWNSVSEHAHGSKGYADISGGRIFDLAGNQIYRTRGKRNGHQEEHHDLFRDLRAGKIPNEGDFGAKSTMTAIFGRMATYSGQELEWDKAIASQISLADFDNLHSFDQPAPVQPDGDGKYPVPIPGVTVTI